MIENDISARILLLLPLPVVHAEVIELCHDAQPGRHVDVCRAVSGHFFPHALLAPLTVEHVPDGAHELVTVQTELRGRRIPAMTEAALQD